MLKLAISQNMRNLIIAALVVFLLYTNSTFRSYTLQGLQTVINFIKELPKEEKLEKDPEIKLESGLSTY